MRWQDKDEKKRIERFTLTYHPALLAYTQQKIVVGWRLDSFCSFNRHIQNLKRQSVSVLLRRRFLSRLLGQPLLRRFWKWRRLRGVKKIGQGPTLQEALSIHRKQHRNPADDRATQVNDPIHLSVNASDYLKGLDPLHLLGLYLSGSNVKYFKFRRTSSDSQIPWAE